MGRRTAAAAAPAPPLVAPASAAAAFAIPAAAAAAAAVTAAAGCFRVGWRPRGLPTARRAVVASRPPPALTMGAARGAAAAATTAARGAGGSPPPPPPCPPTTLITWNVASLRALLRKHPTALERLVTAPLPPPPGSPAGTPPPPPPDVVVLQETKLQATHEATMPPLPGYTAHFSSSGPPAARGYAGVAMYVRDGLAAATAVTAGVGWAPADAEGRCLTARLPGGRPAVVGVYAPNAGVGLKRLAFRVAWDAALVAHVAAVRAAAGGAGVVLVGDLNVAPDVRLDVWEGRKKGRVAGLTAEERAGFATLLTGGGGGAPPPAWTLLATTAAAALTAAVAVAAAAAAAAAVASSTPTARGGPTALPSRTGATGAHTAPATGATAPPAGGGGWTMRSSMSSCGRRGGTPGACTTCRARTMCRLWSRWGGRVPGGGEPGGGGGGEMKQVRGDPRHREASPPLGRSRRLGSAVGRGAGACRGRGSGLPLPWPSPGRLRVTVRVAPPPLPRVSTSCPYHVNCPSPPPRLPPPLVVLFWASPNTDADGGDRTGGDGRRGAAGTRGGGGRRHGWGVAPRGTPTTPLRVAAAAAAAAAGRPVRRRRTARERERPTPPPRGG
ncbi:hypothetical protein I4F81_006709 [Pyropia yezoensis]|uniref:Uncharacterized protein n=1 Tax=Pyropia yezoensis TaxID=2788 RepID=A0ACC3C2H9_PYRYE|nr:hypothetical protein I4F81_006709 [Neopyropia yezoensis]